MMGGGIVIAIANCGGGCFVSILFSFLLPFFGLEQSHRMKSKPDAQDIAKINHNTTHFPVERHN